RTVVSGPGKRRHSSHRYDWMPPTLGGKSLVTSRWRTGAGPDRERGQRARSGRSRRTASGRASSGRRCGARGPGEEADAARVFFAAFRGAAFFFFFTADFAVARFGADAFRRRAAFFAAGRAFLV